MKSLLHHYISLYHYWFPRLSFCVVPLGALTTDPREQMTIEQLQAAAAQNPRAALFCERRIAELRAQAQTQQPADATEPQDLLEEDTSTQALADTPSTTSTTSTSTTSTSTTNISTSTQGTPSSTGIQEARLNNNNNNVEPSEADMLLQQNQDSLAKDRQVYRQKLLEKRAQMQRPSATTTLETPEKAWSIPEGNLTLRRQQLELELPQRLANREFLEGQRQLWVEQRQTDPLPARPEALPEPELLPPLDPVQRRSAQDVDVLLESLEQLRQREAQRALAQEQILRDMTELRQRVPGLRARLQGLGVELAGFMRELTFYQWALTLGTVGLGIGMFHYVGGTRWFLRLFRPRAPALPRIQGLAPGWAPRLDQGPRILGNIGGYNITEDMFWGAGLVTVLRRFFSRR